MESFNERSLEEFTISDENTGGQKNIDNDTVINDIIKLYLRNIFIMYSIIISFIYRIDNVLEKFLSGLLMRRHLAFFPELLPEANNADKLVKANEEKLGNIEDIRRTYLTGIMRHGDLCDLITLEVRADNKFGIEE